MMGNQGVCGILLKLFAHDYSQMLHKKEFYTHQFTILSFNRTIENKHFYELCEQLVNKS
jgi:hypothetical protein